ncbi:MAG TPA: glycosyltransferase [Asticcacaulis sp.]|nr:glycosyltransferase [Asticcacaulis sp.]
MDVLEELHGGQGWSRQNGQLSLIEAWAEGEASAIRVEGQYVLTAEAVACELELVEEATRRRSLICATPGDAIHLFMAAGDYRLFVRFLSPPGDYSASLRLDRQGRLDRLGFLAAKAIQVLQRPPSAWPEALGRLLRRAPQGVTGARLGAPVSAAPPPIPNRPTIEPAPVPETAAVSIIIPTKTRADLLAACVASLDPGPVRKELIIIDNGATAHDMLGLLQGLAARSDIRVIRHDAPFNFSQLCNLGAKAARFGTLLFLNDDIEALDREWLPAMLGFAARPDTGVVGARLLYPSRDLQHAGVATNLIPGPGHPWRGLAETAWRDHPLIAAAGEVDAVTGACLMIGKALFDQLGGFDEAAFAVSLNDVDLCLKARGRGLKVIYAPQATLLHKEGQSRRRDDDPAERARRERELALFFDRYPHAARHSVFYPAWLRRDTDSGASISSVASSTL